MPQLGFDITPAMREAVMAGVPLFSLVSDAAVLDNPSTPDVVRDVIAELVGVDALQLQEGVGRLVVTTSDQVAGQVKAAREAAFDAWFAGSKVVDQEGRPLVVYHGTFEKFSIFDMSKAGDGAHFFTTDKSHAESFGAADSYYISISDPMVITEDDLDAAWDEEHPEGEQDDRSLLPRDFVGLFVNKAKDAGKDGLIIRQMGDRDGQFDMYLPFGPEQIKSTTNNRGTYDPRDPDITHSLAAGELPDQAQAFHDRQSGATFFLADRIPAGKEASVFLHETVHRHGKAHLPEGQFDALVGQVKAWAQHIDGTVERSIHDKAAGRVAAAGVSGPVADEELFAYAVEEAVAMGVQPSAMAHEGSAEAWLQAVVQSIQRVADKLIGNSLEQLGGQDLVDLAYALAQVERPELGAVIETALKGAFFDRLNESQADRVLSVGVAGYER